MSILRKGSEFYTQRGMRTPNGTIPKNVYGYIFDRDLKMSKPYGLKFDNGVICWVDNKFIECMQIPE